MEEFNGLWIYREFIENVGFIRLIKWIILIVWKFVGELRFVKRWKKKDEMGVCNNGKLGWVLKRKWLRCVNVLKGVIKEGFE